MDTQKKIALNMGLLLGLTLTLLLTILYVMDLNLFTKSWVGIVNVGIITVFGVLASVQYKKNIGWFYHLQRIVYQFFYCCANRFFNFYAIQYRAF